MYEGAISRNGTEKGGEAKKEKKITASNKSDIVQHPTDHYIVFNKKINETLLVLSVSCCTIETWVLVRSLKLL